MSRTNWESKGVVESATNDGLVAPTADVVGTALDGTRWSTSVTAPDEAATNVFVNDVAIVASLRSALMVAIESCTATVTLSVVAAINVAPISATGVDCPALLFATLCTNSRSGCTLS
jgi:hypothetical protein